MPLGTWLRSLSTIDQPPEKSTATMVGESLMMELDYQIHEMEEERRNKHEMEKHVDGAADYTWLAAKPTYKSYKMPQAERMEMDEMCMKVKPDECGRVINMFRDALGLKTPIEEVPRLLRASILQVVDSRVKEETIPEWLTKSLGNLGKIRPRSARKVTPILMTAADDLEMQRAPDSSLSTVSMSVSSPASSLPNFYVKSEHIHV